ncbi:MAG: IS1634 family transposase [Planctomycetes bacterium]|nr:IS1634 family transposase [Planctomycetota bacterium]
MVMFLRERTRKKNGKTHRYWSVVENRRIRGGRIAQRQVLYLGELNDTQRAGWVRAIHAFDGKSDRSRQLALFPSDRDQLPKLDCETVQIRLGGIELRRPRQWGGCWLTCRVWDLLELDRFWKTRLGASRKGTRWLNVLKTLVCYRLLDPGSEYRLHREWYDRTALGDLLGEDFSIAQKNTLYRCLDRLLSHREDLFSFLQEKWKDLFNAQCDVLLYDLTSTYFECDPPEGGGKRRFGYSRDHRSDCVQVVIALVITPQGFPLAYEVYPGNTQDHATLKDFLDRIEDRYGKVRRTWLMDRGIPTEEMLREMRKRKAGYLVGTPKGRLSRLEASLLQKPWKKVRESVRVKLIEEDEDFYVYVESADRVAKERSMRQRKLRRLWDRLLEIKNIKKQTRDQLLLRLGQAKRDAGRVWGLVEIRLPGQKEPIQAKTFTFKLNRDRLRSARRREGRYLLRSNLRKENPETVWEKYLLLTEIEQAFKELKSDLSIRPVYHQKEKRIEAHIFVAFLAYCLLVTLKNIARKQAAGLTPRAIISKVSSLQMVDVLLPTTDGRTILLVRYTQPEKDLQLLLNQLNLSLPEQPPPRVYANGALGM